MAAPILKNRLSDVIIAGAGPAGAATAIHLARGGLRVLLMDCRQFPRDKVCGDFVSPLALRELESLGVCNRAEFQRTNRIWSARLFLDGDLLIHRRFPKVGKCISCGRVIPRILLDGWIVQTAEAAGVHLLQNARLIHFEPRSGEVVIHAEIDGHHHRFRTKLLIGADGSNSVVARRLYGTKLPSRSRLLALRAYFDHVSQPFSCASLYFTKQHFPGYAWVFPTGFGGANVGLGMIADVIPDTREKLSERFRTVITSDSALRKHLAGSVMRGRIAGWVLDTYNPRRPVIGPRTMLVGDAAGLINPINGEGIHQALQSGRWAAETALRCVATQDFSTEALSHYARRVADELRLDMAVCNFILEGIRNRHFSPLWLLALKAIVKCARRSPHYADKAAGILAGVLPAREAIGLAEQTLSQAMVSVESQALQHLSHEGEGMLFLGARCAGLGWKWLNRAFGIRSDLALWTGALFDSGGELAEQIRSRGPTRN